MASGLSGLQPPGTTFERILRDFKNDLDPDELRDFAGTTLKELEIAVATIQKKQAETRTMQNLKRIRGFLEAMNTNTAIIEPFLNVHSFVAFIWGPMKFLLVAASTYADSFNKLLNAYERIGENLPVLGRYQEIFETDPKVQYVLQMNFQDIFEFHRRAMKVFKRPVWKNMFRSVWKQFDTWFEDVINNMGRHKLLLESHASLVEFERAGKARELAEREFKILEERELLRRKAYLTTWLAAPDIYSDQAKGQLARQPRPRSGRWLLSKPRIRDWLDPHSLSTPMAWIYGMPGCGKSVLASLIIDEIQNMSSARLVYFYCRNGDGQPNSFVALIRSFLNQLLQMDESIVSFLYETAVSDCGSCLAIRKTAEELLDVCLKRIGSVYIVLDGVDECSESEQKAIISWLRKFIDNSTAEAQPSRCLFLSQYDGSTKALLAGIPAISITANDNNGDIEAYCRDWAGTISEKLSISDTEATQIAAKTSERAQGMFLFAKLVMKNLYDQTSIFGLRTEMRDDVFPKGLDEAYQRILERVLSNSRPAYRRDALRLLAWTVCAVRPLEWREVLCAVAVDNDSEDVDMANRQWRVDHTELCGPLIERQPNGALQLVHSSARFYLLEKAFINEKVEHVKLATLCVEYLSLPAFDLQLSEAKCRENILRGVYAFLDYALLSWPKHIVSALHDQAQSELGGDLRTAVDSLVEALDPFFDLHWCSPKKQADPSTRVVRSVRAIHCRLNITDRPDLEERLLVTLNSMQRFTAQEVQDMKSYETLQLYKTLVWIRARIEALATDPASVATIQDFYGESPFKCSRLYCDWFHIGFPSAERRLAHINRHDRSHICPYFGCAYAELGCKTAKELEAHIAEAHNPKPKDDTFPKAEPMRERLGSGPHECHLCSRRFTKSSNLKAHVRGHSGEKQFACSIPGCSKSFRRQYDRQMHEKTHSGEKPFSCGGWLITGFRWGCGKAFYTGAALQRHFATETGLTCLKPLLDQQAAVQAQECSLIAQQQALIDAGCPLDLFEGMGGEMNFGSAISHQDSGFHEMEE